MLVMVQSQSINGMHSVLPMTFNEEELHCDSAMNEAPLLGLPTFDQVQKSNHTDCTGIICIR